MLKKTIRRLGALAMVLAMAVSVFAVSASAADGDTDAGSSVGVGTDSLLIKKIVTTDGKTYAPDTSFTFTIAEGSAGKYRNDVVYAGVDGGVYFSKAADNAKIKTASITYSPTDSTSASYEKSTTIYTDVSAFAKVPGIYHYTVTETKGDYEGITYDNDARDLYVYVTNKEGSDGEVEVSSVVLVNAKGEKVDAWTNDYGKENNLIHSVTVTKSVLGSQGNKSRKFKFTVSVTSAQGKNERYKVVYKVKDSDTTEQVTYVDNSTNTAKDAQTSAKIEISDTGYIKIYGLSKNDTYKVEEENYSSDGYVTTIDDGKDEERVVTGTIGTGVEEGKPLADKSATVKNTKNTATPGGVIMTIAPYALMVVLAGAFAVVFLSRRNRAE